MINWQVAPYWQNFNLSISKSGEFNLGFGIVSTAPVAKADTDKLIEYYCKFQMAHSIGHPVMIFPLTSLSIVGAPLFNAEPHKPVLFHIPPSRYRLLPPVVDDAPFLVSAEAISVIESTQGLFGELYKSLGQIHNEHGLVVVGYQEEN